MVRLWTPLEDEQLREGVAECATHAELADELNRSFQAVEQRCCRKRIRSRRGRPRDYRKWMLVMSLIQQGKSIHEIARIRGVYPGTVCAMVRAMTRAGLLVRHGTASNNVRYVLRRENARDE